MTTPSDDKPKPLAPPNSKLPRLVVKADGASLWNVARNAAVEQEQERLRQEFATRDENRAKADPEDPGEEKTP